MIPISILNGSQPGEYFGASLATIDLNGDGYDDLIVGAPFYSNCTNSEIKYDTGAVYVYFQERAHPCDPTFESTHVKNLYGETTSGRFGSAISGIADTDNDGFNELAVGAPYENDGAGAVYIYQGCKEGLRDAPGQIIYGKTFGPLVRSFGSSFTFGDFDKNDFNDIVVGAPLSGIAVYLPARPVINVHVNRFSFNPVEVIFTDGKCSSDVTESYDQEVSNPDGMNSKSGCTVIEYCIAFSGRIALGQQITFSLNITLDTKAMLVRGLPWHRVNFLQNSGSMFVRNVTLSLEEETCFSESIQLKPDANTFVDPPIVAHIKISVIPDANKKMTLAPVVNASSESTESSSLKVSLRQVKKSIADLPWWVYLLCALGALLFFAIVIGVLKKV